MMPIKAMKIRSSISPRSSYIWHHAKRWVAPSIILPFILYLGSPWSIYPPLIILPFALIFAAALWVTTAWFKKYL